MYNTMFKSRVFWETVNAKHALVFQTDVHLCEHPGVDLDNFLMYDYVGSPFKNVKNGVFMNGGLSLRNVEGMKRQIDVCKSHSAEDVFFSKPCNRLGCKQPHCQQPHQLGYIDHGTGYDRLILVLNNCVMVYPT